MTLINPLLISQDFRKTLQKLNVNANQDFLNLYNYAKATGEWGEFTKIMRLNYPKLYSQYARSSEILTRSYYSTLRVNAVTGSKINVSSYKPVASAISHSVIEDNSKKALSYGLSVAYKNLPETSIKTAFTGKLSNAVYETSFNEIIQQFENDTFSTGYVRVPSANACAFCFEVSAAVGTSFEEGFDKAFHSNCRCVTVASFENQSEINFRTKNLEKYSEKREEAIRRIKDGEFDNVQRVVPRNSREYKNWAKRELQQGARTWRHEEEKMNKMSAAERISLRKETSNTIEELLPKIISSEPLTQREYDIVDQFTDPNIFSETHHKTITNVSHKDLLWVMRNEYNYR